MTAVEWLMNELNLEGYDHTIQQSKEMEKQQIIDAVEDCNYGNGTEYYNETYVSKGSDEMTTNSSQLEISTTPSQTEISDEEIEKGIYQNVVDIGRIKLVLEVDAMIEGAKWYREQLKQL